MNSGRSRATSAPSKFTKGASVSNPFDRSGGFGGQGFAGQGYGSVTYTDAPASGQASGAGAQAAPVDDSVVETTTATFARAVIDASMDRIVLVDFQAAWCGPCKQLGPIIERVVQSYGGAVKLATMDIDKHPAVAGQLGVQSLPTVMAFAQGRPVDGFMGAVPESEVRAFIDRVMKTTGMTGAPAGLPVDEFLAEATARMEAGDLQGASELYVAILQEKPDEVRAVAGLAAIRLAGGDAEGAKGMLAGLDDKARALPEVAAVQAKIDLQEQVAGLGDPAELQRRLDSNPDDHEARFDLALIADAKGDREAATDGLVEIMRRDREWRDDGARQQLLKLFEAWGVMDPATVAGRRKLSSLLFR